MAPISNEPPPPIHPPPPFTPPPTASDGQARTWNMLCHLSALAGFTAIPLGNIIGPLIVWQIKKNEFPSVDVHGKMALNFQITAILAIFVTVVAGFALSFFCVGYLLFPLAGLIGLADLVLIIMNSIKANNGEACKYPCSIEFVK